MTTTNRRALLAGAAASLAAPRIAAAQAGPGSWPENRTITVVVPFPAGGGTDVVARLIADRLGAALKARFVVENRPGGGGSIGYAAATRAAPDGTTILLTSSAIATMPFLYPARSYEPRRDLVPVSLVGAAPSLLCVGPSVSAPTLGAFVEEARRRPDGFTYASAGIGSGLHLAAELFKKTAGIAIRHVPYKGAALATGDLLGGRIDMIVDILPSVRPLVEDGKLRALGITSARPSPLAPAIRPVAETVPGYDFSAWFGVYLPAAAPAEMAERLSRGIADVLALPDMKERCAALGIETIGSTPRELDTFMATDMARWGTVIRELGITADG